MSQKTKENTQVKEKVKTKEKIKIDIDVELPPDYKVMLLNNPVTWFDAVVDVLQTVFGRSRSEAEQIMIIAHQSGKSSVMVSTKEICNMKVDEAAKYCKSKSNETIMGTSFPANYEYLVFEVEEN